MKKEISFNTWISVFWGGILQFICNIFSWKNKTPFWRVIWSVITVCVLIVTGCLCHAYYRELKRENRWVKSIPVSSNISFLKKEYASEPGWILNRITGEKLLEGIDWIVIPVNEDSLAVFSSKGKRGYLNRHTGHIAIKPQYDHAWIFSEGIAAVAKDTVVYFINPSGHHINDKKFRYNPRQNNYVYHGEYCAMTDKNDLMGLIDKNGDWAVKPKYQQVIAETHNYWRMRDGDTTNGLWYAFTDKAQPINEAGTKALSIIDDLGVIYTLPNHLKMIVDFDGNRVEKFFCRDIEALYYDTEHRDSTGGFIPAKCTLYRYRMDDGYEGLCKENGEIVTEPLYWYVLPINKDLYHCTYKDSEVGIIINSQGEITSL